MKINNDKKKISLNINKINILIINPIGKAGSLLMQSLFDGHEEFICLPVFYNFYKNFKKNYFNFEKDILFFIETYPDVFNSKYGYFNKIYLNNRKINSNMFGKLGDENINVDYKVFIENSFAVKKLINTKNVISKKDFFLIIYLAFALTLGKDLKKIKYIVFHPHNWENFDEIKNDFPNLFLILMTRDFRQTIQSGKKLCSTRYNYSNLSVPWQLYFLQSLKNIVSTVSNFVEFQKTLKSNQIKIIDLVSLHRNSDHILRELCKWLNVKLNRCLYQSTFCNKIWHGNSAYGSRKSLDVNFTNNWERELSDYEIKTIEKLIPNCLKLFNYSIKKNVLSNDDFKKEMFYVKFIDHFIVCVKLLTSEYYLVSQPISKRFTFKSFCRARIKKLLLHLKLLINFFKNILNYKDLKGSMLSKNFEYIHNIDQKLSVVILKKEIFLR